jgi:hypothetical protein
MTTVGTRRRERRPAGPLRHDCRRPAWLPLALLVAGGCAEAPRQTGAPSAAPSPAVAPAAPATATQAFTADLDGDGSPEQVTVQLAAERGVGFLQVTRAAAEPWTGPLWPLWKALPARLDDLPRSLVVLGVWSVPRREPAAVPQRTLRVLGADGRRLRDLWRGSALARPLLDFTAADLEPDGRDELLTLDRLHDRCWLTAYRWNGFGFHGLARTPVPCEGLTLCADGPPGCVWIAGRPTVPTLRAGTLSLEEVAK